jgi:flagellar assembly factor FliW
MRIKTGRFGDMEIKEGEILSCPSGILGFSDATSFALIDPGDDTLILWLQCLQNPKLAFPLLEPKIFKPDYIVRLSSGDLRDLMLKNMRESAVFSILTIPHDVTQMTANIKAPIVINLQERLAKQVVLQENKYEIRYPMFQELRTHLMTIQSQKAKEAAAEAASQAGIQSAQAILGSPISIASIPPSLTVKPLEV